MFGAWQAGAWAALAEQVQIDLVVGASVGALNGYAIACRLSPQELHRLWLDPSFTSLHDLPTTVERLMRHAPTTEFAVTATDLLRLKPRVFHGNQVTARHLIASCAIPLVLPQVRIEGRLYSDGGLLNPLPVWAAVELGATHILALNALPEIPSRWLRPLVTGFRTVAGYHPPRPPEVKLTLLRPRGSLGTLREALHWDRERIERWLAQGEADVTAAIWPPAASPEPVIKKTFPF